MERSRRGEETLEITLSCSLLYQQLLIPGAKLVTQG